MEMYLPLQTQGETSIDYPLPDSFASDGKKKEHEGEGVGGRLWHATPSRAPVGSAASVNRLKPLLLLGIFAVLLLIAKCASRVSSSRVERGRTTRRLAGGGSPPPSDEDPDVTALVKLCLELEESSPDLLHRPPQPALQQWASQQQQQQQQSGMLLLPQRGGTVLLLPQQGQQQVSLVSGGQHLVIQQQQGRQPLVVQQQQGQQQPVIQQQQGQQQLVIQQQQGQQVWLVPQTGPRMLLVPQQGQQVMLLPQQRQQQHLQRQIPLQSQPKRTQGDSASRPPHQSSDPSLLIQQHTNLATQYLVSPVPAFTSSAASTTSTKTTRTTPGTREVSQQPLSDGSSSAATSLGPEPPHHHTATPPGPADGGSLMEELEASDEPAQLAPSISLKERLRAFPRRGGDLHSPPPAKRLMLQVPTEKGGRAKMPAYPSEPEERGGRGPRGVGGPTSPDVWLSDSALNLYLHYNKVVSDDSPDSFGSLEMSDSTDDENPGPSRQPTGHANRTESQLHPTQLRPDESLGSAGEGVQASTSSYQDGASAGSSGTAIGGYSTGFPAFSGPFPFDAHPFYRLPVLAPGASAPPLLIMKSDESYGPQGMAHRCLLCLRSLFKKETLDSVEAHKAYTAAIRLGKFLLGRHRTRVKEIAPVRAAYLLGRRYLLLDAIVSVAHVLGNFEESREDWENFVKLIPTTLVYSHKGGNGHRFNENRQMIRRLTKALDLLKQGKRPTAEETVNLKRYLFNKLPNSDFSTMEYNPYRRDDAEWVSRTGT